MPEVREATLQDYESLCRFFSEVDREHREQHPELFREAAGPAREFVYIRALITDRDSAVWVAEDAGAPVGCVVIIIRESPDVPILVPIRYAMVDTLVVAAAYRGAGVGHALMAQAEAWAERRGIHRIELNVFEFNIAARHFYQRLGYSTLSRRMVKDLGLDQTREGQ